MPSDGNQERGGYRSFGAYVRSQRQLAQLTLRQLAELSSISNPYLSQIERGLHQPSVAVIRAIADALNLSADALLAQVAGLDGNDPASASVTTESAIRADPQLTGAQKSALLSVYRTMVGHPDEAGDDTGSQLPAAGRRSASTPDIASEPAADATRPTSTRPSRSAPPSWSRSRTRSRERAIPDPSGPAASSPRSPGGGASAIPRNRGPRGDSRS